MSWQSVAAVRDHGPRDRRLRLLLFALASRATADGLVTVSRRQLAVDIGCATSTAHEWIVLAIERRWVILLDPGDSRRGVPASYRIAITHPTRISTQSPDMGTT